MPPSAAPEWLRTGWIFEMSATSAPASCASMAARIPAQPAPTTRTSCSASTPRNLPNRPLMRTAQEADTAAIVTARVVLRIERHRLGPRVYVLGARIHEWHLGSALLLGLIAAALVHRVDGDGHVAAAALLGGVWFVAKDWRDLLPARRDTAAWSLGLHVRPHPLRVLRRAAVLPKLAALAAVLAGLVNLASAVTPGIEWRDHLLLQVAPRAALRISPELAVPASLLLFVTAPYLWRRRQGALRLAVVVLVGLGVLNLLKGLDLEEAGASFAVAGLLWLGRSSFCVQHDPVSVRSALKRVPLIAAAGLLLCGLAVWLSAPWGTPLSNVARETYDALLWQGGPIHFHDDLAGVDEAVGVAGPLPSSFCGWLLLPPLPPPPPLPTRAPP